MSAVPAALRAGPHLRRVVLKLAAVHADDRDWILRQLPPVVRARIEPLLAEVETLGIAAGLAGTPELLDELAPGAPDQRFATVDPAWAALLLAGIPDDDVTLPLGVTLPLDARLALEGVAARSAVAAQTLPAALPSALISALRERLLATTPAVAGEH